MTDWLRELDRLRAQGRACVRVTIMDVRGSAPREIGATMLVTDDDLRGTIGGGQLEYECTRLAVERLREQASEPIRRSFPLGAAMGQCCGGVVDVLFERLPADGTVWVDDALRMFRARTPAALVTSIDERGECRRSLLTAADDLQESLEHVPMAAIRDILERGGVATCVRHGETRTLLEPIADSAFRLALFGAGHVGSALVSVLDGLDCHVRWIDGRRGVFPDALPHNVTAVESPDPAREALAMPAGAFYLVMTHSHALDFEICARILGRGDFAFCGLIGSRSKRRRFEKRLRAQAMSESRIEGLTCPIGLAGLTGKRPGEIAVSVAAQLLRVRQSGSMEETGETGDKNVHVLRRS